MQIKKEFFERLYQFCDNGFIEIRKLPARTQDYIPVDNMASINKICTEENQNQYFGVALRDGKAGTKANITQIPALWADIDFKDLPVEIARQKLSQFPFKPSITVHSGHGVHFYWILSEPAEREDIEVIEDVNKRIAIYLGGDTNACDAARILRIPGTMNVKREPHVECKLLAEEDFTYTLDDLLDILPETEESKPKEHPTQQNWLQKAMAGVAEGDRETTAAKLAGYWINKVPPNDVLTILQAWNTNNTPPLNDTCITSTVKSVSRYEPEKPEKEDIWDTIFDSERQVAEYWKYINSLKNNRFLTGIKEIDQQIRGIAGGEVLTIIARAGSFKTALLQNMLRNYLNNSAWGALFFSLEMPVPSVTERYFQIVDGSPGREIESMFADKTTGLNEAIAQYKKDFRNLYIVPTKISLSDIQKYIKAIEDKRKMKIGVIGIDYVGLLEEKGTGEYEIISRIAKGVKNLAKMLGLPIIVLSQTNRAGQDGQVEISLNMGRGSGAIEEAGDFVLGLWQILEEGKETQLACKILKNRKGIPGTSWLLDLRPDVLHIGNGAVRYNPQKNNQGRNSYG